MAIDPTASAATYVQPLQFTQLTSADLANPSAFNQIFNQLFQHANSQLGVNGKTTMAGGVDVSGNTISNVGEPETPADAISKGHAEKNYSATALSSKLEAGGTHTLKTFRALNSKQQQEKFSTFLNTLSNTAPTTNTTVVQASAPSAGTVTVTIPAGYHLRVDGSEQPFGSLTFTVPLPSSQAVTGLTRASGVVTATGSFSGLYIGESIYEKGASDSSFDGTFLLTSVSGSTLQWSQPNQADVTTPATGGAVSNGGCYYVYLKYPSQQLALSGPFPADTQQNRLASNQDGQVLIAVVVVSGSGVVTTQSAAGATVPAAQNNGNRIVARL